MASTRMMSRMEMPFLGDEEDDDDDLVVLEGLDGVGFWRWRSSEDIVVILLFVVVCVCDGGEIVGL